jgi:putative addiction module CopG family antidote
MWHKDVKESHDMRSSKPITVTLGPQLASLEGRLKSGEYGSASEVMRSALRALDRQDALLDDYLRARSRPRSRIRAPASRQPKCSSVCAPATEGSRKSPSVALKVVFRREAEADLVGLYEDIAERSGYRIAGGYIDRIEEACMALATFSFKASGRFRAKTLMAVTQLFRQWLFVRHAGPRAFRHDRRVAPKRTRARTHPCLSISQLKLFGDRKRIINLDAEVTNSALKLAVPKQ